jgi:hypothetical protein
MANAFCCCGQNGGQAEQKCVAEVWLENNISKRADKMSVKLNG